MWNDDFVFGLRWICDYSWICHHDASIMYKETLTKCSKEPCSESVMYIVGKGTCCQAFHLGEKGGFPGGGDLFFHRNDSMTMPHSLPDKILRCFLTHFSPLLRRFWQGRWMILEDWVLGIGCWLAMSDLIHENQSESVWNCTEFRWPLKFEGRKITQGGPRA